MAQRGGVLANGGRRIAVHMLSLGIAPDAVCEPWPRTSAWNWVAAGWLEGTEARRLVRDRLAKVASWARRRRSLAGDPGAVQLLEGLCADLDAQLHRLVAGGAG